MNNKIINRPGGEVRKRYLDLYLLLDRSGSMGKHGKIGALNEAIRRAVPHIQAVQEENPGAFIRVHTIDFGHGAKSLHSEPVPVERFSWSGLVADPLEGGNLGFGELALEIVIMIDTSGSMSNEIEVVKQSCADFATIIEREAKQSVRLALVGFDIGGYRGEHSKKFRVHQLSQYTIGCWPMASPSEFKANIQGLSLGLFGGCGCYLCNEDTIDIFPHVINLFSRNREGGRVLLIISDEIGSDQGLAKTTELLSGASVKTYVLGVDGPAHRGLAKLTGGEFWDISAANGKQDFSSLLLNGAGATIGREARRTLSNGIVSDGTDMGSAIELLQQCISLGSMPEHSLPPVAILVSDGQPSDDFEAAMVRFESEPWAKKMVRLGIAIGSDCDTAVLQRFIGNPEIEPLVANNSHELTRYIKWGSTNILRHVSSPTNSGPIIVPSSVDIIPEPDSEDVEW